MRVVERGGRRRRRRRGKGADGRRERSKKYDYTFFLRRLERCERATTRCRREALLRPPFFCALYRATGIIIQGGSATTTSPPSSSSSSIHALKFTRGLTLSLSSFQSSSVMISMIFFWIWRLEKKVGAAFLMLRCNSFFFNFGEWFTCNYELEGVWFLSFLRIDWETLGWRED